MIPELVNLSRGRLVPPSGAPPRLPPKAEAGQPASASEAGNTVVTAPAAEAAPEAAVELPPLSREELAAQAYERFGADDDPRAAEAYALGEEGTLTDANVDPPAIWSDTAFLAAEPALRQLRARGVVGSAYAFAKAAGREELGDLRAAPLRAALQDRGVPEWVLGQIAELALCGAPVRVDEELPSSFFWRAATAQLVNDLARALRTQLPAPLTHIILVPWLDSGGAERVALWHARAVAEAGGRCLVLATDGRREGWVSRLPKGAQYLCAQDVVESAGLTGHLSAEDCAVALGAALAQTPFDVLHVVNSYLGTRMLRLPIEWGGRRIFYALFGIGRDHHGLEAGFWCEARELKGVEAFLSDNATLPRARARSFGLAFEQFRPIAYPVEASLKYSGLRKNVHGQHRVLWASRLDPEKQPTLVFEIARRMPKCEFHMFGSGVLSDGSLPPPPPNVRLRGAFDGWESLPAEPFECFLFTSRWEGLPNVILEAMGSGLPIVASSVGAVPEVLGGGNGWLVEGVTEPEGYVGALEEVFRNPAEANKRARAALLEVTRNRTFPALQAALQEIGYI